MSPGKNKDRIALLRDTGGAENKHLTRAEAALILLNRQE
jgi:hypothetical protein